VVLYWDLYQSPWYKARLAGQPVAETPPVRWDFQTMLAELEADTGVVLAPENQAKLAVGLMLARGDRDFYRSLPDFLVMCAALAGKGHDPRLLAVADSYDCAWGLSEGLLLSGLDADDPEDFLSPEIIGYIGQIAEHDGLIDPPDILRLGQHATDRFARFQAEHGDDPLVVAAAEERGQELAAQVKKELKQGMEALLRQLESLPLVHGSARSLAQRLAKELRADESHL